MTKNKFINAKSNVKEDLWVEDTSGKVKRLKHRAPNILPKEDIPDEVFNKIYEEKRKEHDKEQYDEFINTVREASVLTEEEKAKILKEKKKESILKEKELISDTIAFEERDYNWFSLSKQKFDNLSEVERNEIENNHIEYIKTLESIQRDLSEDEDLDILINRKINSTRDPYIKDKLKNLLLDVKILY